MMYLGTILFSMEWQLSYLEQNLGYCCCREHYVRSSYYAWSSWVYAKHSCSHEGNSLCYVLSCMKNSSCYVKNYCETQNSWNDETGSYEKRSYSHWLQGCAECQTSQQRKTPSLEAQVEGYCLQPSCRDVAVRVIHWQEVRDYHDARCCPTGDVVGVRRNAD